MKRQATENIMFTCKNMVLFFMYVWVRHGCQSQNLLAGKLNAYGFETSAVRLIFDYLSNRNNKPKLIANIARRAVAGAAANIQDGELHSKS